MFVQETPLNINEHKQQGCLFCPGLVRCAAVCTMLSRGSVPKKYVGVDRCVMNINFLLMLKSVKLSLKHKTSPRGLDQDGVTGTRGDRTRYWCNMT
jgi:hypothetical protein